MTYLLDTNVLSEIKKRRPNEGVDEWFSRVHVDDLYLSAITIGEISRGVSKLRRRQDHRQATIQESWLADLKRQFADRVIPVSVEIAEEWGDLDAGRSLPVADALIAATAKVHNWTLITRNTKDFENTGVMLRNPFTE